LSNRHKPSDDGKRDILNHNGVYNGVINTGIHKMEAAKLFLAWFNWVGLPSALLGFIMNIGDWKAWVLFFIGAAFGIARVVFYCVKQYQEAQLREIERKRQNKNLNNE
jgi:hypothetical protein